jgi:hypothetical protein
MASTKAATAYSHSRIAREATSVGDRASISDRLTLPSCLGRADHIVLPPALATDLPGFMPIRLRKFIGAVLLLALVIVWALVAMALAQPMLASANHVIEALYYVVAGLGWVLPAMPLITWMSRPDPE